jgi:hypothetical protein
MTFFLVPVAFSLWEIKISLILQSWILSRRTTVMISLSFLWDEPYRARQSSQLLLPAAWSMRSSLAQRWFDRTIQKIESSHIWWRSTVRKTRRWFPNIEQWTFVRTQLMHMRTLVRTVSATESLPISRNHILDKKAFLCRIQSLPRGTAGLRLVVLCSTGCLL